MKIALLTFHNAYNYGAALQAYGLQCAVKKLGVECEYLNYQNSFRKHAYDMKYQFSQALANRNPLSAVKYLIGSPVMAKRAKKFEDYYKKYLYITERVYKKSEEAKETNDYYDKFIVGSDQVWNYSNNGRDTAFLLDFVEDNEKKISYSSSFGVSSLSSEIEDVYGYYLSQFYRLSTRESIGTEIIEQISGRKAHLVLDPVFLIGREEWDKIKKKNNINKKKYIFFYTNRQSQIKDFLNSGYEFDGEYHVLSTHISPKDLLNSKIKTRVSISPEEFLDEINEAELVVTASFHCLAFAIIYHKQFVVILTGDYGKDERIINLLRIAGLENRVLTSSMTKENVLDKINYEEVEARIEKHRNYSIEYLKRAIFDEPDIGIDASFKNKFFCQDSRCFGCGACENVCPTKAISMKTNDEGFLYPTRDEERCVNCFKCHDVCQVYTIKNKVKEQHYYGAKNMDEIRKISSSGGMFRALAEYVFDHNGIVCAAGMDKQFKVYHMFATNEVELEPMCGTYYVQSRIGDAYKKIGDRLKKGKLVLFVGTACQVKGLKDYLGSDINNLITCDIVCHGVPSPMVFDKFIEFLKSKGDLSDFKFRDKSLGWKGYHVSAIIDGHKIKNKLWLQSFNNLFSHNMINRISCGSCTYSNYNRPGDVTIGDFWGVKKACPEIYDSNGVSLVITNSKKGIDILKKIQLNKLLPVSKKDIRQNSLIKPSRISNNRLQVFQSIIQNNYSIVMKKYGEVNFMGEIKNNIRKIKNDITQ